MGSKPFSYKSSPRSQPLLVLRTVVPSAGLRLVGLEVTALRMTEGPRRLSHRPGATLTHAAIWCSRGVCRAENGASL